MALTKFNFKAGINKEETELSNEGGWVDAQHDNAQRFAQRARGGWAMARGAQPAAADGGQAGCEQTAACRGNASRGDRCATHAGRTPL